MEKSVSRAAPRPRFVSIKMPREISDVVDNLKELCQNDGVYLSERQLVGRNGVVLAVMANLTTMPEDVQYEFVMKGVERLKKMGVTDPSAN